YAPGAARERCTSRGAGQHGRLVNTCAMAKREMGEAYRTTLAEEAGAVRLWLTRWFRRRVQNTSDVEDLVQDVFARMVARDSPEPVEHLGGYVLKTASSVLADRARRHASHGAGRHVELDSDRRAEAGGDSVEILCIEAD